ncbi:unnamed protein product [Tilletia caries]|nr:hypothetical protein CF335_g7920 [Tilletia laevis]CAD6929062.1 unnamed protein product [Tilletia caries]
MSLLPPEGKYNSEEAFVAAMRTFTARRGYALVIGSSYKFHDKRNVYYQCDRGGKHRDNHRVKPDDRVRNRSSRVSGCPFRLKLQEQDDGSFWLWHDINSAKHTHNHALSTVATVHPSLRKLNDADCIDIVRQTSVGITPKQILALQQPGPSNLRSLPRDIYNMSAKARREASHCSEPPETLLNFLRSEQYQVAVRSERLTTTTSRMTGILFSHPTAITLTNRFPLAITIDATYKTNRYGMPLVHIIGLTSTNATFCSAVALITREREEDYVWLLREYLAMMGGDLPVHVMITDRDAALGAAIKQIFPQAQHNLCRWHINKNITTNCKPAFDD